MTFAFRPFSNLESPPPADLIEKLDRFRRKFTALELPPSPPPIGSNILPFVRPSATSARRQRHGRQVRVPTGLLGKLLDGGKASAPALHLLAIRCSRGGPGFALNERDVSKRYAISRRSFQPGINLMKDRGVLKRQQSGKRAYAKEELAADDGGYVSVSEAMLSKSSSQVAFELIVNMYPSPLRPAEAAKRIGVTSPATIRKLTRAAVASARVASGISANGAILLARHGFKFEVANGVAKNVPAKNVPAKNVPTQSLLRESKETERRTKSPLDIPLPSTTESEYSPRYDFLAKGEELKTNSVSACVNHIGNSVTGDGQKVCAPALVFECGDVKITEAGWAKLIATYRHLDITSAMQNFAPWMNRQRSWKSAMHGILYKKNFQAKLAQIEAEARGKAAAQQEETFVGNDGMTYTRVLGTCVIMQGS